MTRSFAHMTLVFICLGCSPLQQLSHASYKNGVRTAVPPPPSPSPTGDGDPACKCVDAKFQYFPIDSSKSPIKLHGCTKVIDYPQAASLYFFLSKGFP